MLVVRGENYTFDVIKRIENTKYEWEANPTVHFRGRPASNIEKKYFRLLQGINANSDSVYIITSNLPDSVKPKDKCLFLGREWQVQSVGFYFDNNQLVNAKIMSDDYIKDRCPKGIVLG